jgi:hypothetical protein
MSDDASWGSEREVTLERVENNSFGISIVGGKVSKVREKTFLTDFFLCRYVFMFPILWNWMKNYHISKFSLWLVFFLCDVGLVSHK